VTATLQWYDRFVTDEVKPGRLLDPNFMRNVGLNEHEGSTQSLHRKKVSLICRVISSLRPTHILLGHSNIDNIFDHLGFHINVAIALAEPIEICVLRLLAAARNRSRLY
jgi:hypothetical protein